MRKIHNWDEWIDYFRYWQDSIGLDRKELRDFHFDVKFGPLEVEGIEFGHYQGQRKWKTVLHIPDQRIRDTLLNLVVYQGDTEFASVEQQRNLLNNPPSSYDLLAIMRVMCEEMRHGWQMSYLLCEHFGDEGKREAQKLLERRAEEGERLLGSFNEIVDNWLDFFTYTQFIDRDGKFQLKMLWVVKAGRVEPELIQKFFNKWVPTAFDLFGTDHSSSAQWAYVWGLKGRFDEHEAKDDADKGRLNELSRVQYFNECQRLVDELNKLIPKDQPKLGIPDLKFRRAIGDYAGKPYSVEGKLLAEEEHAKYLAEVLPGPEDERILGEIFREK